MRQRGLLRLRFDTEIVLDLIRSSSVASLRSNAGLFVLITNGPFKRDSPSRTITFTLWAEVERDLSLTIAWRVFRAISRSAAVFSFRARVALDRAPFTRLSGGQRTNRLHRVWLGKFCSISCIGLRLRLEQSKRVCASNSDNRL